MPTIAFAFFAICQNIEQNSLFMSLVSWGQCQPTAPFCPAKNEQKMNKKLDQALDDLRSSFSKLEAAIAEQRAGIRRNGYITIPNDPLSRYEVGKCEGEEVIVDDWAYMIGYDADADADAPSSADAAYAYAYAADVALNGSRTSIAEGRAFNGLRQCSVRPRSLRHSGI